MQSNKSLRLSICCGPAAFVSLFFSRFAFFSLLFAGQALAAPFAYVVLNGNKVAVVDVATNTVTREIAVGDGPYGVATTPSGRYVYVTNVGSHNVSVIDTLTNTVTSVITPMAINGAPYGIALNTEGTRLYVTNLLGASLSVIEPASGLPIAQIPLPQPRSIAINPAGTLAYVAASTSQTQRVVAVDLRENRVVAEIPAIVMSNILFSPDGSRAYFAQGDQVAVVNASTHSLIGYWPPRSESSLDLISSIALSADGSRIYAVTSYNKRLNVIDAANGSVISRFTYGDEPTSIVINPAQQTAILFGERTGVSVTTSLNTGGVAKSYTIGLGAKVFGSAVTSGAPAQAESNSGGGGGCGYISGTGGPPDPTLPALAVLALLTLLLRSRSYQRRH